MPESIHLIGGIAQLARIAAVRQLESLGHGNDHRTLGLGKKLHLVEEFVNVEHALRKINGIHAAAVIALGQCSRCGQPAGIASHNLRNHDGRLHRAEGLVVADDLLDRRCDIFCRRTIAGAMVRDGQIVVDGLWNPHKQLALAMVFGIVTEHLHRIHRVIAARIEKCIDVMRFHDPEDVLVDILVSLDLRHLEAAGTQEGRRCSLEQLNAHRICKVLVQINQLVLQKALNAVNHSVNMLCTCCLCAGIHARDGRVDDGGRAARLTYYYILHKCTPLIR